MVTFIRLVELPVTHGSESGRRALADGRQLCLGGTFGSAERTSVIGHPAAAVA
jgi:hypothetical protein